MSTADWFKDFRNMHDKAKRKVLTPPEKRLYQAAKEQFAKAMCAAQGLTLKPGETARLNMRISQVMPVELSLAREMVKAATMDISLGGFSSTLAVFPEANELVGYIIKLPGGVEPLVGRAQAVSMVRKPGNARVSFAFQGLSEADSERLELVLFDSALSRVAV